MMYGQSFLVGQGRTFFGGVSFCLSDHYGVMSLFDLSGAHASQVSVTQRKRALAQLRDHAFADECCVILEMERAGRQAAPSQRADAAAQQSVVALKALQDAVRVRQRRQADLWIQAFGDESLFCSSVNPKYESLSVVPVGAADLPVDAYRTFGSMPNGNSGAVALGGLQNVGETCYLNSVVQVLLRLPVVQSFLNQHVRACSLGAGGCVCCALHGTADGFGARSAPLLARHRCLVSPSFAVGQHDVCEFTELLVDAMCQQEIRGLRFSAWAGVVSRSEERSGERSEE